MSKSYHDMLQAARLYPLDPVPPPPIVVTGPRLPDGVDAMLLPHDFFDTSLRARSSAEMLSEICFLTNVGEPSG